ncbi:high frequency lysogenization protein HflD [Methylonatrum kenyense]|uniref:high frequency lysogenization protein HflD n=1 Tax=Methylonatrum kenyense TaxID=455253 RepID=UPI0020BDC37C|nr:high frequency lysogenization protein HflD [Methylonatrum kenyense]MCK8515709.1 high frequency lysogenization protein HflD [Methylonatrum kenyense]
MNRQLEQQVLALAVMTMALAEVRRIANTGRYDTDQVSNCYAGLLNAYEGDLEQIYGGLVPLKPGLQELRTQLSNPQNMDQTRLLIGAVTIERKLLKRRDMLQTLAQGLDLARSQAEHFGTTHENVTARLGDLYAETVSTLKPRILVPGKREWLEDPRNARLIRALLLSAIRAATFWRNNGGSRLKLIFSRNRLLGTIDSLLERSERMPAQDSDI